MTLDFGNSSHSFFNRLTQKTYLIIGTSLAVLVVLGVVVYALSSRPEGSTTHREAEAARAMLAAQNYVAHRPVPTSGVSDADRAAALARAVAAAHKSAAEKPR